MRKRELIQRVAALEAMLEQARRDYLALQRENWKLQTKLAKESRWSGR